MRYLKLIASSALYALLMAGAWMILTEQFNPEGFLIGYALGFAVLLRISGDGRMQLNPLRLPLQIAALLWYIIVLVVDITLSGIDMILRIFGRRPVNPAIIRVKVGDERNAVSAMTAHSISITPGELVVDFDDEGYVYVHCIDVAEADTLDDAQEKRLRRLQRIIN